MDVVEGCEISAVGELYYKIPPKLLNYSVPTHLLISALQYIFSQYQ